MKLDPYYDPNGPYEEGRTAFYRHEPRTGNPYVYKSEEWKDWDMGWYASFSDEEEKKYFGPQKKHR